MINARLANLELPSPNGTYRRKLGVTNDGEAVDYIR